MRLILKLFYVGLMTASLGLNLNCSPKALGNSPEIIVLNERNTIFLNDEFNELTVGSILNQAGKLDQLGPKAGPIYLVLKTPGGSITSGIELIAFMNSLIRPVHTITIEAMSMGFQTVNHLGIRYSLEYSTFMSHKASGGFRGEFGDRNSSLDARYNYWLAKLEAMDKKVVERTNGKQTLESYRKAMQNELWLNGWEAVEQGYADKIITARCDKGLLTATYEEQVRLFGFLISLTLSKCPLNTNPINIEIGIESNQGLMYLDTFIEKGGEFGNTKSDLHCIDSSLTLDKINKHIDELLLSRKETSKPIQKWF